MIFLITGGTRSGKTSYAENLAKKSGNRSVTYIATGVICDDEMSFRVKEHQKYRPESWVTVEEQFNPSKKWPHDSEERIVILDCIATLTSNYLIKYENLNYSQMMEITRRELVEEINSLLQNAASSSGTSIFITNEVGQGVVPETYLGRVFRDLLGLVNQQIAAKADKVILMVSGIPVTIASQFI